MPNQSNANKQMNNNTLEDVSEPQAGHALPNEARDRLLKFASRMDQVALLDPQTQQVHLDEQMFHKALDEAFPAGFAAAFLKQIRNEPDNRLITSEKSPSLKPLQWLEFATRQGFKPGPTQTSPNLGQSMAFALGQVLAQDTQPQGQSTPGSPGDPGHAMRQILPGLSDAAIQPGALEQRIRQLVSSQAGNEAVLISSPAGNAAGLASAQAGIAPEATRFAFAGPNWNGVGACCQRQFGWWAWPALAWVLVCFVVTLPNLLLGLALAAASVGLGAATIILNCIISS